jgi:methionyl aminopeptidase
VPNIRTNDNTSLKKGMIIAVEPFASTGAGLIEERGKPHIHSLMGKKPVRSAVTREVLNVLQEHNGLPFSTRWLLSRFPAFKVNFALSDLAKNHMLHSYAPLVDIAGGLVSQAEHTILIDEKVTVLTKFSGE